MKQNLFNNLATWFIFKEVGLFNYYYLSSLCCGPSEVPDILIPCHCSMSDPSNCSCMLFHALNATNLFGHQPRRLHKLL